MAERCRVALLAAMPSERKAAERALRKHHAQLPDHVEVIIETIGMGTEMAAAATERVLQAGSVDHVVVAGVAGGVLPGQSIGDVIVPETVRHARAGTMHRPTIIGDTPARGTLLSTDDLIVDPSRIAELAAEGIVALDMESAGVGAVCERHGCPWSVFRSLSDRSVDGLVDETVFALAKPDGTPNFGAVARLLVRRPWEIRRLARLGRDLKVALDAAADAAVRAIVSLS